MTKSHAKLNILSRFMLKLEDEEGREALIDFMERHTPESIAQRQADGGQALKMTENEVLLLRSLRDETLASRRDFLGAMAMIGGPIFGAASGIAPSISVQEVDQNGNKRELNPMHGQHAIGAIGAVAGMIIPLIALRDYIINHEEGRKEYLEGKDNDLHEKASAFQAALFPPFAQLARRVFNYDRLDIKKLKKDHASGTIYQNNPSPPRR